MVLTCPMTMDGKYISRELATEQTLENLWLFSDKLAQAWETLQQRKKEKQ